MGDILTEERNGPAVGRHHTQDHAERRGLSGPVSPEQADDLLLLQYKADLVNDASAVVRFDKLGRFQKDHAGLNQEAELLSADSVRYIPGQADRNQAIVGVWISCEQTMAVVVNQLTTVQGDA
jgi:hypothetical protein